MKDVTRRRFLRLGKDEPAWREVLARMDRDHWAERIREKDAALWKTDLAHEKIIANALGWLTVARTLRERAGEIVDFAASVRSAGFSHVVLCGMGGSSLAPEVFARTFQRADWPELIVLDATSPEQVRDVEKRIDLRRTYFLISSKSGGTLETLTHFHFFHKKVTSTGASRLEAGKQFAAITDPDSPLENIALEFRFHRIFQNFPDIGGRYSALSYFGMVPAALCGADIGKLLDRAIASMERCQPHVPVAENPGLVLGAALGALARKGRDKATLVCSPEIASFGTWLEQLIAESTGKEGRGIVPVEGEGLGDPSDYGRDRFFLYERVAGIANAGTDAALDRLVEAGHPVAAFSLADRYDIAGRMFIWEFAVAAAGAVLGIDAFDQPNVQESKDNTNRVLTEFEKAGRFPAEEPAFSSQGLSFFGKSPGAFFQQARAGRDYVALQAYADRKAANEEILSRMRIAIRNSTHCATTVGFGPRFLHSTGQLHKGGPDEGLFLQFVAPGEGDVRIPGMPYGFAAFLKAQAIGDEKALLDRKRRFLRVTFDGPSEEGLRRLSQLLTEALEVRS